MEFEFNPRDVRRLAALADEGTLGIPEFQRPFIWRPPAIADLLRTVARSWPAGSFLLLKGPQDFACKPLRGAPPLIKEPTLLILDGQQRITALYQAFGDQAPETYYVDMMALLAAGELEDEHVTATVIMIEPVCGRRQVARNCACVVSALFPRRRSSRLRIYSSVIFCGSMVLTNAVGMRRRQNFIESIPLLMRWPKQD
jgi:hypothetical protein